MGTSLRDRLAAAPITWGVCEVPQWGHQLTVHEVLSDMEAFGFARTEMGPFGFLPTGGSALASTLDRYGLSLLGGFVALVVHDPERLRVEMDRADAIAAQMAEAGAAWFISCPISDHDDWQRPPLSTQQWNQMVEAFSQLDKIATAHGLCHAFHPHFGALIQDDAETRFLLENTETQLVLDTAHLTLGGSDPRALVDSHAGRIGLVHLKDLDAAVAARLGRGEISLMTAVQLGLFPPLGQGAVPLRDLIETLETVRPDLWYVLEQDAALDGPDPAEVERLRDRVAMSLKFVQDFGTSPRPPRGVQDSAST